MKRTFLYNAMCAMTALAMVFGCEKAGTPSGDNGGNGGNDDSANTSYTVIASPLSVNFGWNLPAAQTVTVTTNAPDGFTVSEAPDWFSYTVAGNKVTITAQSNEGDARSHTLKITAKDANTVNVIINQVAKGEVPASLQGQKYVVWQLDASSMEYLGDKVILNLMPNGFTSRLDIWPAGESLVADESATGANFYGNMGGYVAFQVGNVGWSGGGYAIDDADGAICTPVWQEIVADNGEGWYLHAAIKGTKGVGSFFRLCDLDPDAASSYILHWDNYDINEADWTEVEVPMTEIVGAGWTGSVGGYSFTIHGSGKAGDKFHYDALFIYKK